MAHTLTVLDPAGGTPTEWDPADPKTRTEAEKIFNQLRKKEGCLAYAKDPDTGELSQIHEFDPEAREITLSRALQGG